MGITPSPPTTPRAPERRPQPAPPAASPAHSPQTGSSAGASYGGGGRGPAWEPAGNVFISPRPSETNGGGGGSGGGGHGGGGNGVTRSSKENRSGSAGRHSSGGAADGDGPASALSGSPYSSSKGGVSRLRESTNTRGNHSAGTQQSHQYYALSSRGGAAQPLSDMDFVHALMGGASGTAGGRKRAVTSAGGVRARSAGSAYARTASGRSGIQAW